MTRLDFAILFISWFFATTSFVLSIIIFIMLGLNNRYFIVFLLAFTISSLFLYASLNRIDREIYAYELIRPMENL